MLCCGVFDFCKLLIDRHLNFFNFNLILVGSITQQSYLRCILFLHRTMCVFSVPSSLCKLITPGTYNLNSVYINSFLATLNARESLKSKVDETSYMMMSLPTSGGNASRTTTESSKQKSIAIRIDTTTEAMNENSSVCLFNLVLSFLI